MKSIITILLATLSLMLPQQAVAQVFSKMSPLVRQAAFTSRTQQRRAPSRNVLNTHKHPTLTAFVRTDDADALRQEGCSILAEWGDIHIANIPLNKIENIAQLPQVQHIEAGSPCSITLDTTAVITHAKDVWNATADRPAYTGKGVIVGVMDIGFDLTHPTFWSRDMQTYRIKAFWDMLDSTLCGDAVTGKDTIYVGRQYIGQDSLLTKAHATDGFTMTHGTHTAGIAAGSGSEGGNTLPEHPYTGMAPDADICLVANCAGDNLDYIKEEDRYKYTTATDILGFKYIFDYAVSQGKPCVINFSEGAHDDLYESKLYCETLDSLIGPGRILCSSAGNESWRGTYVHKSADVERSGAFLTSSSNSALYLMRSTEPIKVQLTFYPDKQADNAQVWTYDAEQLRDYPDSVMTDTLHINEESYVVMVNTYPSCYDETLWATDFYISDTDEEQSNINSKMPIALTVNGLGNDVELFSGGGYFMTNTLDKSLNGVQNDHNILFPGCAENVICVGNVGFVTQHTNYLGTVKTSNGGVNGALGYGSSIGPTLSGLTKPDVSAPGMNIVSSYSSYYLEHSPNATDISWDIRHFDYNGRTYVWNSNSGTSMSSPVVTGIVALWLELCPTLTPTQIKDVFAHTCHHHDESMEYPNNTYGYGLIDAEAGIEYIQKIYTGIVNVIQDKAQRPVKYYDLQGRPIQTPASFHGIVITTDGVTARKMMR